MLAMVRESMFQIAGPWLDGGRVLDLFSGSGSLGLEALSRGAASVRFFEISREARETLEQNIALLGGGERCTVVAGDAVEPGLWGPGPFDLVLLDPPFPMIRATDGRTKVLAALEALAAGPLEEEGLIVLHVPRGALTPANIPADLAHTVREHGDQAVWYLQRR
ncbi:Ribosomal RNA small subunit methyltransferase D [Planctomycetes bacterium Pla86]|uniref:Ribosomal RNA small subunit methyltransferase D n=2 Tax=Engelhardtia mirabilis TaxID=2528011 RepID=A0A518BFE3_9BACT|nr:Ribosomal RNA small subunit methyltransferase D [Planctomycetes bacterium Pla133]QDV00008.1 Ribosomal RNA small subunit methyltransferase D [Planctomycetes bacterium Pla86]